MREVRCGSERVFGVACTKIRSEDGRLRGFAFAPKSSETTRREQHRLVGQCHFLCDLRAERLRISARVGCTYVEEEVRRSVVRATGRVGRAIEG